MRISIERTGFSSDCKLGNIHRLQPVNVQSTHRTKTFFELVFAAFCRFTRNCNRHQFCQDRCAPLKAMQIVPLRRRELLASSLLPPKYSRDFSEERACGAAFIGIGRQLSSRRFLRWRATNSYARATAPGRNASTSSNTPEPLSPYPRRQGWIAARKPTPVVQSCWSSSCESVSNNSER
jgi:hypothetical protein